jgi:hypothetical protein
MKKYVLLSMGILALLFSCTKSDDSVDTISLAGKSYAAYAYQGGGFFIGNMYIDSYDVYWVYRFVSDTEVEYSSREKSPSGKMIGEPEKCTYQLDYPNLTIYDGTSTVKATFVNEDAFRTGSGSGILEYVKQ